MTPEVDHLLKNQTHFRVDNTSIIRNIKDFIEGLEVVPMAKKGTDLFLYWPPPGNHCKLDRLRDSDILIPQSLIFM